MEGSVTDELAALAARLYEVGCESDPTDDFKWNCRKATRLAIARECLRQMRWARAEMAVYLPEVPIDKLQIQIRAPLTLAPPDWQPWPSASPFS